MSAKRPAEETIPAQRRIRIKLASPSPERTSESDTESIHSCQGYKTELATDTDTSSPSPPPTPAPVPLEYDQAEYEIAEPEEQKQNYYFSDGSGEQENLQKGFFSACSDDSFDNAVLGDTSEENSTSPTSNSDVDPGLPRNDYLDFERCLMCQTEKKNISYPYCSPCFTWRKNFFPRRPRRKPKDFKKSSSQCGSLSDRLFEDSGVGSTETPPSEDTVDGPSQLSEPSQPSTSSSTSTSTSNLTSNSSNVNNSDNSDSCRVCFLQRENGLFVHLNTAHRYGCYTCAKKIWYSNGGCPLCRRKVFKVTQLFI